MKKVKIEKTKIKIKKKNYNKNLKKYIYVYKKYRTQKKISYKQKISLFLEHFTAFFEPHNMKAFQDHENAASKPKRRTLTTTVTLHMPIYIMKGTK